MCHSVMIFNQYINLENTIEISFRSSHKEAPTTWQVCREIIRTQGFGSRGLNKGLTATIGRNGVFNMIYFGLFHSINSEIPQPKVYIVIRST